MYKITVTNTSYQSVVNTGVVLTDRLPPGVLGIIKPPTGEPIVTDPGRTCTMATAPYSLPPITVTCALGSLTPGETATVSFTASITVIGPTGEPQPPKSVVNTVHVESDQQTWTSTSVKTLVTVSDLRDDDILAFLDATKGCVKVVPVIGWAAGWVWEMLGRDLATGQPNPHRKALARAVTLGSEEVLVWTLDKGGQDVGLPEKTFTRAVDSTKCIVGFDTFLKSH
jgi:Domain of unknown function DUF11